VRVLQFIGDTDVEPAHVAALALHRALTNHGVEVRTLALAPGRHGGLEQDVPAVAPSRRSLAARGQVRAEARWADVVVLHGVRALTMATTPSRSTAGPAVVIAHWDRDTTGGSAVTEPPPLRRPELAVTEAASAVVVTSAAAARDLEDRLGGRVRALDHRLVVLPADLADPGRPELDLPGWTQLVQRLGRA
jgi:hypothetical protein